MARTLISRSTQAYNRTVWGRRSRIEPIKCDRCKGYPYDEFRPCASKRKLKAWPEQEGSLALSDLTEPLVAAIEFAYSMERRNKGSEIPYEGYALPGTAGTFGTCDTLSAQQMDYSDDEQGYNALEQLVGEAVRLGMENERRLMVTDRGATFDHTTGMFGGGYRSSYTISAAVEEAIEESGLDPESEQAHKIESGVRWKLRDLDGLAALNERHHARVEASLERSRVREEERRAAMTPEEREADDASRKALFARILGRLDSGDEG